MENMTGKCPNCGGNKFQAVGGNTNKCMYCGTTFTVEAPQQPTQQPYQQQAYQQQTYQQQTYQQPAAPQPPVYTGSKSKIVAGLLGIFLGSLGIHKFYIGKNGAGVVYLLLTLLLCWTIVVPSIMSLIGFIEGIMFLCMSDTDFNNRFNR